LDSDPIVDEAIERVGIYVDTFVELEDGKWHAQTEEEDVMPWIGLIPLPEDIEPSPSFGRKCDRVLQAWNELSRREFSKEELEGKTPERHVLERYQRAASIASNEMEGFFKLTDVSKGRLTRIGFQLAEGVQIAEKGSIYNSDNRRIAKDILRESYDVCPEPSLIPQTNCLSCLTFLTI
jgi:hypothetical protein